MSTETKTLEEQATAAANAATPQTTSLPTLRQILNAIRGDSRDKPAMYLEETEVPHGGE